MKLIWESAFFEGEIVQKFYQLITQNKSVQEGLDWVKQGVECRNAELFDMGMQIIVQEVGIAFTNHIAVFTRSEVAETILMVVEEFEGQRIHTNASKIVALKALVKRAKG